MNLPRIALSHRPITIVFAILALVVGASSFFSMSRRENPRITIRSATIETYWPGASATKVEDLVTIPIEDAIAGIEEIETLESKSRAGYSKIEVELLDSVTEDTLDQVWDNVRHKIDGAQSSLPSGATTPFVNSDFGDVAAICLTLHQLSGESRRYSLRELEEMAEDLEKEIKTIDAVANVLVFGNPEEAITLEVEAGAWSKLGLDADSLARALDRKNVANSGLTIESAGRRIRVPTSGELLTVESIRDTTVSVVGSERPVKIRDLPIKVTRAPVDPRRDAVRFTTPDLNAPLTLMLGITMKEGQNVVTLGDSVSEIVEAFRNDVLPDDIAITRVNDLPRQVDSLVADFIENLWQAIVIVLVVAWLMMGWRPALVMSTAIPLSMISTLFIIPRFGVELEQFAIASLIIVLGMVVDNAIVVTDNVQRLLDEGQDRLTASIDGAWSLSRSILSSTLTTVGAFLPMITIPGASGEYMRSLPIVVSTTLLSSFVVAMTVTPMMCFAFLRSNPRAAGGGGRWSRLYRTIARSVVSHRWLTLGATVIALGAALGLLPQIGSQFFPGGVRDQFFIHVHLPTGATLAETEAVVARVERELVETSRHEIDGQSVDRLVSATSLIGTGGPRVLLSLNPEDSIPNYALILVNSIDPEVSRPWAAKLQNRLRAIPGARIDVRPYALGPPVDDPIEFRLQGRDLDVMTAYGEEILGTLNSIPGVVDARRDWGQEQPRYELAIDAERADLASLSTEGITNELGGLYSGRRLTTLREGDHLVDVELRLGARQRNDIGSLRDIQVEGEAGPVPLSSVASLVPTFEPSTIARRNRRRALTIGAQAAGGFLANDLTARAWTDLQGLRARLPEGYSVEVAGESEETAESQGNIGSALQISLIVIFLVLLFQYNSTLKPVVVLCAFPLSLIGALLGLFVSGWPLGFMPMLGIVALAGTVINNAIVLIEFVETEVAKGTSLREAVVTAGLARMKPILLTTLTTVGGLVPLALFGGPMWAGMAWAMIFGLSLSTGLTLLVIPTVYVLFAELFRMKVVQ